MTIVGPPLQGPPVSTRERAAATIAFATGMAFNVASLFIGNPYVVAVLAAILSGVAVVLWHRRRFAWVALGSALAANPVNLNASIACNVLVACAFLIVRGRHGRRPPVWLFAATALALLSVLASVPFWSGGHSPEVAFTQGAAVGNYVVAPLLLIPIFYAGIGEHADSGYLARGLLLWLVAPSVLMLALARTIGVPVADPANLQFDYVLVAVYRLANVDVTLTRTQVGIVLAAISCASFALFVAGAHAWLRWGAGACMATSLALLLLTGSVGSAIAMALGWLAILLVVGRRVRIVEYLVIGLLAAALLAVASRFLPAGVLDYASARYSERFSEGSGIGASDRAELWTRALGYALENPTGVGFSLFIEPLGIYPHNDYLVYAIGFGWLCGVLYAFVVGRVWWSLVRVSMSGLDAQRVAVAAAGLGVATVLIVNSFSDHLTANRWYFNVVWSMVWYCLFAASPPATASLGRGR